MKPAVTGVEQVERFDAGFVGSEVLEGLSDIPRGDVFPLAETGREDENCLQNPRRGYTATPVNNL